MLLFNVYAQGKCLSIHTAAYHKYRGQNSAEEHYFHQEILMIFQSPRQSPFFQEIASYDYSFEQW